MNTKSRNETIEITPEAKKVLVAIKRETSLAIKHIASKAIMQVHGKDKVRKSQLK